MDTYFLVNVVHNDFKDPGAIFAPFLADAANGHQTNGLNGYAVNGAKTVVDTPRNLVPVASN